MIHPRDQNIINKTADTDEPTIVFRAQDRYATYALHAYLDATDGHVDRAFSQAVIDKLEAFKAWQGEHLDKLKTPDL